METEFHTSIVEADGNIISSSGTGFKFWPIYGTKLELYECPYQLIYI